MNHTHLDGKQRRDVSRPVQLGELLGRMELLQGGWGTAQGEKKEVGAHKWETLVFVCSGLTAGHIACNCSQGWCFQLLYVFVLLEGRWNSGCLESSPLFPKPVIIPQLIEELKNSYTSCYRKEARRCINRKTETVETAEICLGQKLSCQF